MRPSDMWAMLQEAEVDRSYAKVPNLPTLHQDGTSLLERIVVTPVSQKWPLCLSLASKTVCLKITAYAINSSTNVNMYHRRNMG